MSRSSTTSLPIVPSGKRAIEKRPADRIKDDIREARSHELVFAVVGYAGSGTSTIARKLVRELESRSYLGSIIKATDLIRAAASEYRLDAPQAPAQRDLRSATWLQDRGDQLRARFGSAIVAGLAVRGIRQRRREFLANHPDAPRDARLAHVIDSLKNPEEVDALRSIYGHAFYLVSVTCSADERRKRIRRRLSMDQLNEPDLNAYMERDEHGAADTGQRVRKTIHLADFFIDNQLTEEELPLQLARLAQVVLGEPVQRPTREERGMHAAWSAAHRSACLSRQVGAAIQSETGEIIAMGTNDAPRAGGGLYETPPGPNEVPGRCFELDPHCRNDRQKSLIYEQIYDQLRAANLLTAGVDLQQVRGLIEQTRVKDLIEFSRAVHAEMDALLSISRSGGPPVRGATLYTTTYPCHSCARHIVAAGVQRVIFLEAYPKSLASHLHGDAVVDVSAGSAPPDQGKVEFLIFRGVAPRRFFALFEKQSELKNEDGSLRVIPPTQQRDHIDRVFTKSFEDFERTIEETLQELGGPGGEDKA